MKEIESSEKDEGERVVKGKKADAEKVKDTKKNEQDNSFENLSDSEEGGEVSPSKKPKSGHCKTIDDCAQLENEN